LNPAETCLVLPGDEAYGYPRALGQSSYGRLLVYVDIPAPGENLILLTAGAYLNCDHVTGDELRNQMFTLPAEPTTLRWDIRLPSLSDRRRAGRDPGRCQAASRAEDEAE
jgi:hypothetical protein